MGNCLPSHGFERLPADFIGREEFIMETRSDGKKMEFTAPLVVRDLVVAQPKHSVVQSEDATCRTLSPAHKSFVAGQLYRLLFVANSSSLSRDTVLSEAKSIANGGCRGRISRKGRKRTPPFSVESVQDGSGITRVKMVISKRELEAFLSDYSMKEKSSLLQSKVVKENHGATRRNGGWRPSLGDIPELS